MLWDMTRVGRWIALDYVGHGEGLAGAGDPEEHLIGDAGKDVGCKFVDSLRLVAGRRVVIFELKIRHNQLF